MEMANITYLDTDGGIKVKVDHTKCVNCGRCVLACKHDARYFEDDVERFFNDLADGAPVSLIAAPSVRTNMPDYKRLFTYLKELGVKKIYDVSLGADICIWAHVRHIEKNNPPPLITQPCPVIVSYCEVFQNDLLKYLSPVHSPMACIAVYMKEYEGITDRIAALSPCIAKADEFEDTGLSQYNITFVKLREYLDKNNIELPNTETGFDHYESGLGSLFPMPGGLKENIEFFLGKPIRIDRAEGKNVFRKLDIFKEVPQNILPEICDFLNCDEGCNEGPGSLRRANFFEIGAVMDNCKKAAVKKDRKYYESVYKTYDDTLELPRFMREYRPVYAPFPRISDDDIAKAFELLGKHDYSKQNVDCGACGSDTCHNMARKIALNVNIPENCIVKSRDDVREEHAINTSILERFETIWEHVESGIAIIDAETHEILDVNPVTLRMFGDCRDAIVGKECREAFCPAQKCPVMDLNQNIDRSERKFVKADGELIPVIKSVSRIHYNGRLALLENFTDVSHIKEAEEQMRLFKVTEQASRAKSEFLSRMSHEMRTPMNAIIGMTQIAAMSDDAEKLRYCLSMIENSSTHLLGLINDILDMSKIEAGKFELENAPLNLEKTLQKVCNLIIDKIEQKNIEFNIVFGADMAMNYIGDELRLSQVITNLMSNAVKFTPDGGKIEIVIEEPESKSGSSVLRFTVRDTGIGMTEEQISRLFNAFEQADSSTSRKFGGTGLGLTISKYIVEKMNGRIWAESEQGVGSAFIFEVKLERSQKAGGLATFDNIRPEDVNLLIVSNNDEERVYFKSITKRLEIKADEAPTPEKAAALAKQAKENRRPYGIIFVDYGSADFDGVEIIKQLNNIIDGNTVIIVITSFLKWNQIEEEMRGIGVRRFMPKPFFPSEILDAVNEEIGKTVKNFDLQSGSPADMPDFSNRSILLVDDVEINREIFITLLEGTGVNIDSAENGVVAVKMFTDNPDKYDMIMMDIQMPEMDGYQASGVIRALGFPRAKTVPIIAMTANVLREDVEKCLNAGMDDHLGKPLDFEKVLEKMQKYLTLLSV